ncbi:hypothetical protein DFH11DRAFT_1624514, partial [Phellopilus nigrolimitatus]
MGPFATSKWKGKTPKKPKQRTETQNSKEGQVAFASTVAEPSSPDVSPDDLSLCNASNALKISTSPGAGPSEMPSLSKVDIFNMAVDRSRGSELGFDLDFDVGDEFQHEAPPPRPALLSSAWDGLLLPGILDAKVHASASASEHASTVSQVSKQTDGYSTPPSSFSSPSLSTRSLHSPLLSTSSKHFHPGQKRKAEEEAPRTNCTDPAKMVCLYKGCQVELTRDKDVIRRHIKTHKQDFEETEVGGIFVSALRVRGNRRQAQTRVKRYKDRSLGELCQAHIG